MHVDGRAALAAPVAATLARESARLITPLFLIAAVFPAAGRAAPQGALDLRSALALARAQNPALNASRASVAEARGELTGASVLLRENPEVELGAGPRWLDAPGSNRQVGLEASVSQRLEIAGQRGRRVDRASAEVAAAEADADAAGRTVDLAVATAFYRALGAEERVRIAGEHERLARELLEIARARDEKGAASPVEINAARVRAAEASRLLLRARADEEGSRARLAPLLGLDAAAPLALQGGLPEPRDLPPATGAAVDRLPAVAAAARRLEAASAAAGLASAAAWPDLRLGARYTTEEASRTLLGTLSVPIPVFQRNQGERERARAAVTRSVAEEKGVRAQATAEIREAEIERDRALQAARLYDRDVLKALDENLALLRRMLAAGKVSAADAIVLQREALEGHLGFIDARIDLAVADARARTAAGLPILDDATGGGR